jgi:hypothetical protein
MTLCALSKQPQIIFVLLELMVCRLKELPWRWRSLAIVVLPAIILSPLWVVGVSADIAVWRLLEERKAWARPSTNMLSTRTEPAPSV